MTRCARHRGGRWTARGGLVPLVAVLGGCSTLSKAPSTMHGAVEGGVEATSQAATRVASAITREEAPARIEEVGDPNGLGDAVLTPVKDMNLRRVEVPDALARIQNPYADLPETCVGLVFEMAELDAVLGPDYDDAAREAELARMEQAKRFGIKSMGNLVGDLVPFRGVVRRVSGASRAEAELREAFRLGLVRRGYLRGVSEARECEKTPDANSGEDGDADAAF